MSFFVNLGYHKGNLSSILDPVGSIFGLGAPFWNLWAPFLIFGHHFGFVVSFFVYLGYHKGHLGSILDPVGSIFGRGAPFWTLWAQFLIFWAPFLIFGVLFRPSRVP